MTGGRKHIAHHQELKRCTPAGRMQLEHILSKNFPVRKHCKTSWETRKGRDVSRLSNISKNNLRKSHIGDLITKGFTNALN